MAVFFCGWQDMAGEMVHGYGAAEIGEFYARLYAQNERVVKLGLASIGEALGREPGLVGYPHILVAGTNGKGQVSATLANAFFLAGYVTGLFTSPHLVDFRERIRVDGRMIPCGDLARIGGGVLSEYGGDATDDFSGVTLTYFECCLMMALRYYRERGVNFGIFEVGLGGRLDATNALSPAVSVVASISHDHEQYLGHTLESIAHEKAGIMRRGRPVVSGRSAVAYLRREAADCGCGGFYALGEDFEWRERGGWIELETKERSLRLCRAGRLCDYQCDNAAVAAFTLCVAKKLGWISGGALEDIVLRAVCGTRWVGRMWRCPVEVCARYGVSEIVLDGAHNPDGARVFCNAVDAGYPGARALVVNSCEDKDVERMFELYPRCFDLKRIFVCPISSTPRAMAPRRYCARIGLSQDQACGTFGEAFSRACRSVGAGGAVFISGSLYLLGDAIRELRLEPVLEGIFEDPGE